MDYPQSLIALGHRLEDDAEGQKVVELIQGDLLGLEFAVDAVVMLQAAADFTHQIMLRQFLPEELADLLNIFLPLPLLPGQTFLNLLVGLRLQVIKGQVFQFRLNAEHPQPSRQGGVDIQGLLGDALLPLRGHIAQGAHVMNPVRQLHQQDPDVMGHGEDHLADVFRLLGDAVPED